jgi:hypothetical protein
LKPRLQALSKLSPEGLKAVMKVYCRVEVVKSNSPRGYPGVMGGGPAGI